MSVIAVFGGTTEGRLIAETFCNTQLNIHICVATEYGAALLPAGDNIHIHTGRMDLSGIENFLEEISPSCCIDATHPYASEATENIYTACENTGTEYIRLSRPSSGGNGVLCFESIEKAAEFLDTQNGNILITTGSRDIEKYTAIHNYSRRCFPRILPISENIEKCCALGFENKNIIALQPPFSEEMNISLLKHTGAEWLVTKNSGREGGFDEKYNACLAVGVGLVVICRNENIKGRAMSFDETIDYIKNTYNTELKRELYIIGMGTGDKGLVTRQAEEYIARADVIIGAERIVKICGTQNKPVFISYNKEEIYNFIHKNIQYRRIAFLCSGDTGLFSASRNIRKFSDEFEVHNIAGIASPVYFMNRLGKAWENTLFVSRHGISGNIVPLVRRNESVCVLSGSKNTVCDICIALVRYGLNDVRITVGERLSYADEKITEGIPSDFTEHTADTLSLILIENNEPLYRTAFTVKDSEFIRGSVPMTKEEVRTLSIAKLGVDKNSVVYDIGAGTGSVSVELALKCHEGMVYAVEKNKMAVELIESNRLKFCTENMEIIEGEAPGILCDLPSPTHVFIGGSGGQLENIIKAVRSKNPYARFVINVITLDTLSAVREIISLYEEYRDADIIQLGISRAERAGDYHIMKGENPVYIVSFGGKENCHEK